MSDSTARPLEVEVRPLRTHADYAACVALQKATWGADFAECVPATILNVSQRIGGIAAGAFDTEGRLLGFVFGMSGVRDGRLAHWSDMLAVRTDARNLGIGRKLKEFQKRSLQRIGIERVFWTFDPLVAANAHLNLNTLGAEVIEYVPDMYADTDSALHSGLGTDRFIVQWDIARSNGSAPPGLFAPEARGKPPLVRVQIPADIHAVKARSIAEAAGWRSKTRAAFQRYLNDGYEVRAFVRPPADDAPFYLLGPADETEAADVDG